MPRDDRLSGPLTASIVKTIPVVNSARVMQLSGIFDVPPTKESRLTWEVSLPLHERPWNIGAIVGASGTGKSSVAHALFTEHVVSGFPWPEDKSLVDGFADALSITEITSLLSSVGFSSPPSWLRPFRVLSMGEQFRATVARALAESRELTVIDEFTSVVDRTVAKIGSAAVAKAVRARGRQLVAVSCHYDILEWLQPDWVYEPADNRFAWRALQRRPPITLEIWPVDHAAWQFFRRHHYLSHVLHSSAACFVGFIEGQPAVWASVLCQPGKRSAWREHRTVCLPDFQGVGIGNAMSELIAGCYRAKDGKPYFSTTSNPAMIRHRAKSALWKMHRLPTHANRQSSYRQIDAKQSRRRITAGFEFVGPARPGDARSLGILRG
jgi:ABC-type thiamine transport system ATPase subunit